MENRVTYAATLPDVPRMDWHDVLMRLKSIGAKVPAGAACVSMTLLLLDGEPAQWYEPTVQRLEPRRAARQFITAATDPSMGE